jgi:hypothetical protein
MRSDSIRERRIRRDKETKKSKKKAKVKHPSALRVKKEKRKRKMETPISLEGGNIPHNNQAGAGTCNGNIQAPPVCETIMRRRIHEWHRRRGIHACMERARVTAKTGAASLLNCLGLTN